MIQPMLAYKVGKKDIDYNDTVFLQPKLDGIRCVLTKDGAFSRTGKKFYNVQHIEEKLKLFFEVYPNMVLDGELYNHDLRDDFNQIVSLVRTKHTTAETRLKSAEMIQYHVYDIIIDEITNYKERYEFIKDFISVSDCIKVVDNMRVSSENVALGYHHLMLKNGYEGSILRLNKPYEQKRSYNLQKFKDFQDTEAIIIGYEEGKGKRAGTLGKFIMRDFDGNEFGCPPGKGFNYDDMRSLLNDADDYIGRLATFTFFQRTPSGSYRHPFYKSIRNYE